MAISFSCPECGKTLKSAAPIAAGKRVKCPGCGEVWSPTADDETTTAVQAKAPLKVGARASRRDDEDDDAVPRSKAGVTSRKPAARVDDDDDDDDEPRSSRRRDDDDDEGDDRPKKKKKKGKKQASSKLPLILALSGAGVLLVVFGVTAFLWPGFLLSKGGGGGAVAKNDKKGGDKANSNPITVSPLAYAPPKAGVVMGVNYASLKQIPGFADFLDSAMKKESDDPFVQLMPDCELLLAIGTSLGKDSTGVAVVQTQSAYDQEALKKNATPVTSGGQSFFKGKSSKKAGQDVYFAMPHERVLVQGTMSEQPLPRCSPKQQRAQL